MWEQRAVLLEFDLARVLRGSWSDHGGRAALLSVAPQVRGKPVLDLGGGTGRTTPWLVLLSDDYVAIDYTPEMIRLFRRASPKLDVRIGDARALEGIEDERFGLVLFSFNGIDSVDHEGRQSALRSMHRVLSRDGFSYCTHNTAGPCFLAPPWRPAGPIERESWMPWYWAVRAA